MPKKKSKTVCAIFKSFSPKVIYQARHVSYSVSQDHFFSWMASTTVFGDAVL